MDNNKSVVIVGGGHAGGNLVTSLRHAGFNGNITLVSEENTLPYHRPPLSKMWLKDTQALDRLYLKPPAFYKEKRVTLALGKKADRIDRREKILFLEDGSRIPYDYLVLATGARARTVSLPGDDFRNVLYLRNLTDAENLKRQLTYAKNLTVIGGGYIGLEVAASARELGLKVSVIERESHILARVASETLSSFYRKYHQTQGVEILLNEGVIEFKGKGSRLDHIVLASGEHRACDITLIGIGAVPNDELARDAGLLVENGIVVDHFARTSDSSIFAIGDVSHRPLPVYKCNFRLENISNTLEQAKIVSSVLTGTRPPAQEVPWFWSDQYDIKLQIAGLGLNSDQDVVRGDPESNHFSVFRFLANRLMAVEAVNSPADFMIGKKWIGSETKVDKTLIADTSVNIRDCVIEN